MDNKEFVPELTASLQQAKSKKQINADIRQLEKAVNLLRLTATLAKGDTKKEINASVRELSAKLSHIKLKAKIDSKNLKKELDSALKGMRFQEIDALKPDVNKTSLKLQKLLAHMKTLTERKPLSLQIGIKKEKLEKDLTTFLNQNTKLAQSDTLSKESQRIRELVDSVSDKKTLSDAANAFRLFRSQVTAAGYAGKSASQRIKDLLGHLAKIGSLFDIASVAVNNFVKSLSTLRSNDTILTQIGKTAELTKRQLQELGEEAFQTAGKYGRLSSDYLLGVREMAQSGYEKLSKDLAELSLLAQSAGDMTAERANDYLLATDAAYRYSGSVEKLTAALDGAAYISRRSRAGLADMADAVRISASFAAGAGVAIEELTAAEAAMIAVTKRSGSEVGRAFRSILMNLRQVSGEFDGEIIDYNRRCSIS